MQRRHVPHRFHVECVLQILIAGKTLSKDWDPEWQQIAPVIQKMVTNFRLSDTLVKRYLNSLPVSKQWEHLVWTALQQLTDKQRAQLARLFLTEEHPAFRLKGKVIDGVAVIIPFTRKISQK